VSKGEESGLGRWSRRKARARSHKRGAALPPSPAAAAPAKTDETQPPGLVESVGDVPVDAAAIPPEATTTEPTGERPPELPSVEDLDYDSDYAPFLSPDVSDSVRKLALRRLWRSNPILANVDGLVDYDDDFTDAATVIEGLKSVYQVGRGMLVEEEEEDDAPPEDDVVNAANDDQTADTDVDSDWNAQNTPGEPQDAEAVDSPIASQNDRDAVASRSDDAKTQTKPSKREV